MADAQPSSISSDDSDIAGIADPAFEAGLYAALAKNDKLAKREARKLAREEAAKRKAEKKAAKANEASDDDAATSQPVATAAPAAPLAQPASTEPALTPEQIRARQELEARRKHWMDLDSWAALFPDQQPMAAHGDDHVKIVLPGTAHALHDFGHKIVAKPVDSMSDPMATPDPRAIVMMVSSAKARGWQSIAFTGGNDEFKLCVALEAERQGIPMSGYALPASMTAAQVQEVRERWQNTVASLAVAARQGAAGIANAAAVQTQPAAQPPAQTVAAQQPAQQPASTPPASQSQQAQSQAAQDPREVDFIRHVVREISDARQQGNMRIDLTGAANLTEAQKAYYWLEGLRQGVSVAGYLPDDIKSLPVPSAGRFALGRKKKIERYLKEANQLAKAHLDWWIARIGKVFPPDEASALLTPPPSAPAPSPATAETAPVPAEAAAEPATVQPAPAAVEPATAQPTQSDPVSPQALKRICENFVAKIDAIAALEKKTPQDVLRDISEKVASAADPVSKTIDLNAIKVPYDKLGGLGIDLKAMYHAEARKTGLVVQGGIVHPDAESRVLPGWDAALEAIAERSATVAPAIAGGASPKAQTSSVKPGL